MKSFLRTSLALLPILLSQGHATLPDYVWGLAPFSYQNLNRIQIQVTDDWSLYGYRGDFYQYTSPRMINQSKWAGWDFSSGMLYQIMNDRPINISAGAAYHLTIMPTNFFESDPSIQLDFALPFSPITLEMKNNFEIRYIQHPPTNIGADTGSNKYSIYRWEPLIKISSTDGISKLQLTPYFLWQGHFQNKRSRPNYAFDREQSLPTYIVPFYNEIEAGFQAKLTPELGLGIGDKFMFLPTRSKTGYHRLTTYLTWYIDLSHKSGN